jgi:endonuclease/exonuclease/phosphatase family metal-dependent hydrolase
MLSAARFDYSADETLGYFADQINALQLDVVCLQESHTNAHDSLAKRLATQTAMAYFAETPGCPSHIDPGYRLTTAVISRLPFTTEKSLLLPHPTFALQFAHNGKVVQPYDRYAQIIQFNGFTVATMHTEPLQAFGLSYAAEPGKTLSRQIDTLLCSSLANPLLFAADFNMYSLAETLPSLLGKLSLQEALPAGPTSVRGTHPDHILYSPEWQLSSSGIVHTQSDHFLCWAEFELASC